jgi:hypothetical protein
MIIAAFEQMPPTHAQLFGAFLIINAVTFSSVSLSKAA